MKYTVIARVRALTDDDRIATDPSKRLPIYLSDYEVTPLRVLRDPHENLIEQTLAKYDAADDFDVVFFDIDTDEAIG